MNLFLDLPLPFVIASWLHALPTVNASLNSLATVLLVTALVLIKQRKETAHKWTMLAAVGVSAAFLASYLTYHFFAGRTTFQGPEPARTIYLAILLSHTILAMSVPFLVAASVYFGLTDRRAAHRRVVKWAFPIWLYVSVTGVVIYFLLYHIYPSQRVAG